MDTSIDIIELARRAKYDPKAFEELRRVLNIRQQGRPGRPLKYETDEEALEANRRKSLADYYYKKSQRQQPSIHQVILNIHPSTN